MNGKTINYTTNDNYSKQLSPETRFFLEPKHPRQRQYEALRAYFVENLPAKRVADMFGYTPGAFYVLSHQFRNDPVRDFFVSTRPGPKYSPKADPAKNRVIELRKKNHAIKDIHLILKEEKITLSPSSIWTILKEEGFARLPRRKDEDLPKWPRPERAQYADVRKLSLAPRVVETRIGGVFLLLRILADMRVHTIPTSLGWYGSKMIPTENAFLSSLLLKLIGKERKSHVMDMVFDEGAGLAVGLNDLPKTAYICEYSERITHADTIRFTHKWLRKLRKINVVTGESFNLDFQSLPYFGQEDVVEKHYVSMCLFKGNNDAEHHEQCRDMGCP